MHGRYRRSDKPQNLSACNILFGDIDTRRYIARIHVEIGEFFQQNIDIGKADAFVAIGRQNRIKQLPRK